MASGATSAGSSPAGGTVQLSPATHCDGVVQVPAVGAVAQDRAPAVAGRAELDFRLAMPAQQAADLVVAPPQSEDHRQPPSVYVTPLLAGPVALCFARLSAPTGLPGPAKPCDASPPERRRDSRGVTFVDVSGVEPELVRPARRLDVCAVAFTSPITPGDGGGI